MQYTSLLKNSIIALVVALIVLVPFIAPGDGGFLSSWAGSMFFPYILGKNIAFRVGVLVLLGLWLVLLCMDARYRPRASLILTALAFFLAVVAVANMQGVDPFKSFWSNFERMEGYVTLLFVGAYALIAGSVLRERKDWLLLWSASISGSFVMALFGISEFIQEYVVSGEAVRIDTTFGNPIYYAVYALVHVFVALLLLSYIRGNGQRARFYQVLLVLAAGINALMVVLTLTRGSVLALGAGLLVTAFLTLLFVRKNRIFQWGAGIVLLLAVVVAGSVVSLRGTEFAAQHQVVDRFVNISLSRDTVEARFMNWGIAWQGIQERPLLGWGQGNYVHVYAKYYDPHMWGEEPWFDRTHSFIFDWLIAAGFLGLGAYLFLFVAFFVQLFTAGKEKRNWLWRTLHGRKSSEAFSPEAKAVLAGLMVAYLLHNAFVFDSLTSYMLLALVLAFVHAQSTKERDAMGKWNTAYSKNSIVAGVVPVAVVLVVAGYMYAIYPVQHAARGVIQASMPQKWDQTADTAVAGMQERFIALLPYNMTGRQEIRERMFVTYDDVKDAPGLSPDISKEYLAASIRSLEDSAARENASPRLLLFLSAAYETAGMYTQSESVLERAVAMGPQKEILVFQLASIKQRLGKIDEALALLRRVYEDVQAFPEAGLRYGAFLLEAGRVEEGVAVLESVPLQEARGGHLEALASMWAELGRYEKVTEILQMRIDRGGNDSQLYASLAAAYIKLGDIETAKSVLEKGKSAFPEQEEAFTALLARLR